uniref:FP protein C-terminal domain-containing protein n=1 Tax=Heliothis virescens TaxID=7102 RepID=A0A2A4KAI6_HELVI
MPASKCGGCEKFMSPIDAATCIKCSRLHHRACVGLPTQGSIPPTWCCPDCRKDQVRDNKAETPVRGLANSDLLQQQSPEELMDTSQLNCTALDTTINFSPDLADELRLFKEELRAEFRLMHEEFLQLRTEMAQLKAALNTSGERIDAVEARVEALEKKFEQKILPTNSDHVDNTIAELKCQLNERDQELLLNDIEITGIPECKDESTLHLVKVLAVKLGIALDERDLVHAERVGATHRNRVVASDGAIPADPATQRPRSISVRLARRATRDALLRAARVRRGLSTDELDMVGPPHRVYVNERLTRINRQLFYRARQAASLHSWKYVWTRDGKILARKDDRLKVERIRREEDVTKIFG